MDSDQIIEYLSFIAPVPYTSAFIFRNEVYEHAKKLNYVIDEYNIKVNAEMVFKQYKTTLKTSQGHDNIFDIHFKDFYDNGKLIAWMWFGISKFDGVIDKDNKMRGLRLRKENIQIGNEDTLQKLFKEDRGSHYYAGEVFAVSKELIPNSQRDYFNENPARVAFEKETRNYFNDTMKKIYYDASKINSAKRKEISYRNKLEEHKKKSNDNKYMSSEHRQKAEEDLKKIKRKCRKSEKVL